MAKGKRYTDALKRFDREAAPRPERGAGPVQVARRGQVRRDRRPLARLGVDPRKADQIVRGTVALPAGTGKDVRVAVFAQGEAAAGRS